MPTGGTVTEEDQLEKPPAAKAVHGDDHGIQSWEKPGETPPKLPVVKEVEKREPEVDEFGLPVKPPRRRLDTEVSDDEEPEIVNGQQQGAVSRRSSVPNNARGQDHKDGSSESHQESQEKPTTSTHDSNHDRQPSGAPTIASIPNSHAAAAPWSHQALAPPSEKKEEHDEDDGWQEMPALAQYDLYDDDGRLIARQAVETDEPANAYTGLGGAGKGYTRVQIEEDALSATSMDENTDYLFKPKEGRASEDEGEQRDPLAQMQATKDLLTEGQRIAYVGVTRLAMATMVQELEDIEMTKGIKKELRAAVESMKMWSQQMMVRVYKHMEIDYSEQVMIEQLNEHGVQADDLTPALMQNARVKNPMAENDGQSVVSPNPEQDNKTSGKSPAASTENLEAEPLPAYKETDGSIMPEVRTPSQLPVSQKIDIDLRWTVLCDLFLLLIADSIYDSRSRRLLENVGTSLKIPWLDICRFEKRITDSLEMQEAASKETWDEAEHMENRRKLALKRRYMMMGIATVGGSLVIGLSAGLLAPVIGAGLAAGFTTIGVAGTSGFLAGAGGTALITSGAVVTGGTIAVRATNRRTGAVSTFEYRPLHNNKRVNLIVTVSGWMNGKVDDVRLPFSTIDPVMGDMYSILWEPEMLQSMGDTIRILATEALTQGLQQVLGSTILVALMASLQLPIVLTKLSYLIDNPWTVSMARANSAGLILADSLVDRNLGVRPITLVGFSLGARVIFACLRELANKNAFGLIQNVYLFGSPIVANKDEYLRARTVVSGRFVNGYASNDWILGYLFRATSGGIMRVAGLAPVENIPGLENIDVTQFVNGHMAYRAAMPRLLREVGWEVESDEFTEIEDPDPDNHEKRQRELIRELDEARKDAESKGGKRRFGLFKREKLAKKKGWETYDDSMRDGGAAAGTNGEGASSNGANGGGDAGANVLFDIDAIRAELASEMIEVKQLESTLPPMKLEINGAKSNAEWNESHTRPPLSEPGLYDDGALGRTGDTTMAMRSAPADIDNSSSKDRKSNPYDRGYDEYIVSPISPAATTTNGILPVSKQDNFHNDISPIDSNTNTNTNNTHSTTSLPSPHWPSSSSFSPADARTHSNPSIPTTFSTKSETDMPENEISTQRQRRPTLMTANTLPSHTSTSMSDTSGFGVEHNAWLDEDEDEEFREGEGEVRMTFG
ncbi:MAG: hypothetical protein LQ337_007711 [Flavoplaca oasis]|nr:MAG: hypothetical protein LQ337_007711 [Flavoplaca oasis]